MDTCKIGGITYEIKMVDSLENKHLSEDLLGIIEWEKGTIELNTSLKGQILNSVLIHEITHGVLYEAGYDDHTEEMADRISKILYQLLSDNDFSFLQKKV